MARQNNKLTQTGFTLLELLVYLAIFVLTLGLIVYFAIWSLQINAKSKAQRESTDAARFALGRMLSEINHADRVYYSTSLLDASPGQLSLETAKDLPAGENITYVDFYLDNGIIYMKKEGVPSLPLTPDSVNVTALTFFVLQSIANPSAPPSVRINLEVEYRAGNNRPAWQDKISFLSAAGTLRLSD